MDFERKTRRNHQTSTLLPLWLAILLIAVIVGAYYTAFESFRALPRANIVTEENLHKRIFIGENAYHHVKHLSVDIGVRYQGTANNELLTVNFLRHTIEKIAKDVHPNVTLELDHQISSGTFNRGSYFNIYRGVQNIVVRLKNKYNDSGNYILLNSHFDSVMGSPGAGDDGSMVGVMLELLRVLSKEPTLRNPIVFLWNGAEEVGYVGSYAFVADHPWWKNVKLVLNLDIAGIGGREILFQAAPEHPWLVEKYGRAVPSPYASTVGQELFEAGIIPSDTDFSIFRAYRENLPAMDFAQTQHGQIYHTGGDSFEKLDIRGLQHVGNNIVALLNELQKSKELDNVKCHVDEGSGVTFFDWLGWFMIRYKGSIGVAINSIVFVAVILITFWAMTSMARASEKSFIAIFGAYFAALINQIVALVVSLCFVWFIGFFLDICGRSMSYYAHNWLVFGLFYIPSFFCLAIFSNGFVNGYQFWNRKQIYTVSMLVQLQIFAISHILSVLMIVLTAMGIKSSFVLCIGLLFFSFSTLLNTILHFTLHDSRWLYLHMLQLIPSSFYFYLAIIALSTLIPSITRDYDGAERNPDVLIGLLTAFFGYLATGFYAPLVSQFRRRIWIFASLATIFVGFLITAFTPIGFPFKESVAPQRWIIMHIQRNFYDYEGYLRKNDSGYYVHTYDRHSIQAVNGIKELDRGQSIIKDCATELLCGIPFYFPGYAYNAQNVLWIPAATPKILDPPTLNLINRTLISATTIRYDFIFAGPEHMNLYISALPDAKIIEWSFSAELPEPGVSFNDREIYFINYLHGLSEYHFADYKFYVTVEVPSGLEWNQPYTFDIALSGQFMEHPNLHHPNFDRFLSKFPSWTFIQAWTSTYESRQIK